MVCNRIFFREDDKLTVIHLVRVLSNRMSQSIVSTQNRVELTNVVTRHFMQ